MLHISLPVLRPGGMLALNVVARTSSLLGDLIITVKDAFSEGDKEEEKESAAADCDFSKNVPIGPSKVYLLKASDETANTTLLVIKGGVLPHFQAPQSAAINSKCAAGKSKSSATIVPNSSLSDSTTLRIKRESALEDWLEVSDNRE